MKSGTDQDHCFAYVSGQGAHLQRETGVTEANCTVCPEQEDELILNALHVALQAEGEIIRAFAAGVSMNAARVHLGAAVVARPL